MTGSIKFDLYHSKTIELLWVGEPERVLVTYPCVAKVYYPEAVKPVTEERLNKQR